MPSLATLSLHASWITDSSEEIERASACFEREHALVLPGFLAPDLLDFVQRRMELDGFQATVHENLPSRPIDLMLNAGVVQGLLLLALNDTLLLELVRRMTGQTGINSFGGTGRRRVPGAGHDDAWHNDLVDGRLVAITINLGAEPHQGGILQIREGDDGPIVFQRANPGSGDAILFKIDPRLKHRVTPLEGTVPRTVFTGWFRTEPVKQLFGLR